MMHITASYSNYNRKYTGCIVWTEVLYVRINFLVLSMHRMELYGYIIRLERSTSWLSEYSVVLTKTS